MPFWRIPIPYAAQKIGFTEKSRNSILIFLQENFVEMVGVF
ncbi:hypothetical protein M2137_002313 [Parabacteroides sp. PFB2-10]|nr:hypothetical protein [Parabacteroides sp. PFB2-10]